MKKIAFYLTVAAFAAVAGWVISSVARMPDNFWDWHN